MQLQTQNSAFKIEIERLQAENSHLHSENNTLSQRNTELTESVDAIDTDLITQLKNENAELKAAIDSKDDEPNMIDFVLEPLAPASKESIIKVYNKRKQLNKSKSFAAFIYQCVRNWSVKMTFLYI